MCASSPRLRSAPARSVGVLCLAALCLAASACEDHRRLDNETAAWLRNPEHRHPILFSAETETLDIEVPPGTEGLSYNQHVDTYRFLQRYKREAKGRLIISVPRGVADQAALAHALQAIQHHVTEADIDYRIVRDRAYRQRRDGAPAIRLAYKRPLAVPPLCDRWPEDVGRNEERIPYPNWGCATQRNLAVMVDNSRDLLEPQLEDPRSGERRSVTWSSYIGSSAKPDSDSSGEQSKKGASSAAKK
jgi:pilus assembly protein CpaD